jgi:dipeptidyl aminopeptidase/acylaminoacyl peptidase
MLGVTGENVQAVVSFFGPTDFSTRDWPRDLEREVIVPFLGGSFADIPAVYERASPVSHVTKDSAPFLLFHGTEDELVPVDQSKRLAERLKSFGVPVRLVVLEGEKHGFSDAHNQECMKQMMAFLGERLKR